MESLLLTAAIIYALLVCVLTASSGAYIPQSYLSWKYSYYNPDCRSSDGEGICQDVRVCNMALASVSMGGWPAVCDWVGKGVPKVCCSFPLILGEQLMKQVDAEKARNGECGRKFQPPGLSQTEYTFYQILKGIPPPDIRNPEKYDPPLDLTIKPAVSPVARSPSRQEDFPWMVAIYRGSEQWCGGTLIDRIHVLSAAHCFVIDQSKLRPESLTVKVGNIRAAEGHPYNVVDVVVHEDYDTSMHYHDIAILTLNEEILSPHVPSICLPSQELATTDLAGSDTTLLRWDDLDYGDDSTPILQVEDDIPVVSTKECKDAYRKVNGNSLPRGVTDDFICAGISEGGKDACQKDSGGPLMYKNYAGSQPSSDTPYTWVQLGIVSFGHRCGMSGYPGLYTRVSSYMDWIARNTKYVPPSQ